MIIQPSFQGQTARILKTGVTQSFETSANVTPNKMAVHPGSLDSSITEFVTKFSSLVMKGLFIYIFMCLFISQHPFSSPITEQHNRICIIIPVIKVPFNINFTSTLRLSSNLFPLCGPIPTEICVRFLHLIFDIYGLHIVHAFN